MVIDAHSRPVDAVLADLGSTRDGLSSAEAGRRLAEHGPNRLPDPPREGLLRRILAHVNDLLIYLLLVAVVVTAVLGHWLDSAVILGVVVINALIGFVQEGRAEQALAGLRQLLSLDASARRDGRWARTSADQLVPGDVVRLQTGDRVPADVRLVETTSLYVEEAALTGESAPTEKVPEPVAADATVGDRSCMAYSGSLVATGRGLGVVVATGPDTEIGRISTMISEVETLATPLTRQMNQFGRQLSVAIVGLAIVLFVAGRLAHGTDAGELVLAVIGLAVAAIPEGLPAILTITLAVGVQRMAGRYQVTGTGYAPHGHIHVGGVPIDPDERPDLLALIEAVAVVNDAELAGDSGQWRLTGEPTEGALITLALKYGFDPTGYERWAEVPFESEHKLMATLNLTPDARSVVLAKGAPDRLLGRCGGAHPDARPAAWWEAQIEELSGRGLRVLAAARRDATVGQRTLDLGDLESGLTFLGLVGIADPPRPEAITAVAACREAGIRVKMITGDHPGTAMAVAREMGLVDAGVGRAVTGAELQAAGDAELAELAHRHDVFARTSPEHKLRLVAALQARGEIVAMTGDGVNDAPALKRADVGVAMGIKGTEATKEAAEIVLADDDFVSIERAVEEGRTIYDNLRTLEPIHWLIPLGIGFAVFVLVELEKAVVRLRARGRAARS